ncbi:uncharacterized protein [Onthophagus taurus]|uniref:uncharacterized protein n=1 Tax=Onthophagus taurus TaxID=166361 RepID=UPI0039BE6A93
MAVIQVIFLFSSVLLFSNAFFLPPNDGSEIGDHFLNQKLNFLEGKFKNSPLVDFDLIKQKIEAKRLAEKEAETNPETQDQKLWFLQNKFNPKFNFIKEKIESKQTEDPNLDIFNDKVAFLENLLSQHFNNQLNHGISKRAIKEESNPASGAAIGNYFLNQKLSFLENKFKDSPLVDFELIKQKIEAKQAAKEQEQQIAQEENNVTNLLNYLKQLHAQKLTETHQIAKRAVEETNVKDPSIGNYFLNQKLSFMENKFKGTPIDFETIKNKIEAKKEAKLQEELLENENDLNNDPKKIIQEKLTFLQNFLHQMKADQLKAIIDKIEGNHNVAKRAVNDEGNASKKDYYLNQKYAFLSNKFKQMNMDSEALLQKIQSKQKGGQ